MTRLIALSGKINSGKDTVAGMIENTLNLPHSEPDELYWENVKFSTKLKQMASIILNVPISKFEDKQFKSSLLGEEWGKVTVRQFLQDMGQKMREINPDFWINGLFQDFDPYSYWVISDLRYINEAERVKKEGGLIVRIQRPDKEEYSDSSSETEMDTYGMYDYVIRNTGSIQSLWTKVETMLKRLKIR